jgi:hypothetical protein
MKSVDTLTMSKITFSKTIKDDQKIIEDHLWHLYQWFPNPQGLWVALEVLGNERTDLGVVGD